jgi:hypothetical protein
LAISIAFPVTVQLFNHLTNELNMAEGVGFEPTEVLPSTVFKTAAFDHSAIPPMLYKSLFLPLPSEMVNIYVRFCLHYVLTGLIFYGFESVKKYDI